ncbi:hypothetical protein BISA_0715 [Bifidobacterium saguini DSM 23967]|uniref:Uncharacterized protein n=1 Tax=Bifidobacterium saguini DSM 23967 TaxID=1437607 RepID=A0A087D9W6_9BIFI|nr:hypothetical protein [Bifidobacterium saguini]KFI92316.1 hypothetical protein BISA_0715 [Bifidobacterium saguini DSM 23967]
MVNDNDGQRIGNFDQFKHDDPEFTAIINRFVGGDVTEQWRVLR